MITCIIGTIGKIIMMIDNDDNSYNMYNETSMLMIMINIIMTQDSY